MKRFANSLEGYRISVLIQELTVGLKRLIASQLGSSLKVENLRKRRYWNTSTSRKGVLSRSFGMVGRRR